MSNSKWPGAVAVVSVAVAAAWILTPWDKIGASLPLVCDALFSHPGSQTAAAWMQVVGTVLAIFGGWYASESIARRQRRIAAVDRQHQLEVLSKMVKDLAGNGPGTYEGMQSRGSARQQVDFAAGRLAPMRAAAAALSKLDFQNVPAVYIALPALNAANLLDQVITHVERLTRLDFNHMVFMRNSNILESVPELETLYEHAKRDIDEVIELAKQYDGYVAPVLPVDRHASKARDSQPDPSRETEAPPR